MSFQNQINQTTLKFGDLSQVSTIEDLKTIDLVADTRTRMNAARKNSSREPTRHMNIEDNRWTCPRCEKQNFASLHITSQKIIYVEDHYYQEEDAVIQFQPIITPRIYYCPQCALKRFYWREGLNLYAKFVGKYEEINELAFASSEDPVKFYNNLKDHSAQAKLF